MTGRHLVAVPDPPACWVCLGRRTVLVVSLPGAGALTDPRTVPCPACTNAHPLIDLKETRDDHDR